MEFGEEVKTIQVDYECPNCEVGRLRPNGNVLSTYPAQYPHSCNVCDYTKTFNKTYPYLEYQTFKSE